MQKNNSINIGTGVTAVLVVNVAILAGITVHKKYKPVLEKLSEQYMKLKVGNSSKIKRQSIDYRKEVGKIFQEAKIIIGDVGNLVKETISTSSIQDIKEYPIISKEVESFICEKLEEKKFVQEKVPANKNEKDSTKQNGTMLQVFTNRIGFGQEFVTPEGIKMNITDVMVDEVNPTVVPSFLKHLTEGIVLILALNTLASASIAVEPEYLNMAIMAEVENLLEEIELREYIPSAQHDTQEIREWTVEEQIESILKSSHTYEEKMNRILSLPNLSFEEAIDKIMHLGITSYEDVFDYILTIRELRHYEKMEYIINSDITTYEQKFQFIMNLKDLNIEQKVWYILLIPNVSFETIWNDLFEIEGLSQDHIIKSIMNTDIVSFTTLFDKILTLDGLTKENLTNFFIYYQASYNHVTTKEMIQYILHIEFLTQEEQLNCIWTLLSKYTIYEKTKIILEYFNTTYDEFLNLYGVKDFNEEQSMVWEFMSRVNLEKEVYIFNNYGFKSQEQMNEVYAGCAAEGARNYKDLYCVATTFYNRITNPWYVNAYGTNPYEQLIAENQFSVYADGYGSYLFYLYPSNFENKKQFELARQAFLDMFYAGNNGVAHNFLEFRSWGTDTFSNNYIIEGGNRYGIYMADENRIIYNNIMNGEADDIQYEWVKKLSLK